MIVDGHTQVLGLIGNPVAHTLSPTIHNTIAAEAGINTIYLPFPVKQDIQAAIAGAYALGIRGLNITVPYKSLVIPGLSEIDGEAGKIGAVNTLVRTENGYKGYNTDMPGLYRALKREGISVENTGVIIIGAGGAARAAAYMCALKGAKEVYLLNRTKEKAALVADEVREKTGFDTIYAYGTQEYDQIPGTGYLVLQATKAGLFPNVEDTPIKDTAFFKKAGVVYDLIYNPQKTHFMQLAEEQGIKAYHGLTMLLYQGIQAFELWYDMSLSEEIIKTVYKELKRKCGINE